MYDGPPNADTPTFPTGIFFNVASGSTLNLTNTITGTGIDVVENGSGTLEFGGVFANNYTGNTRINSGILLLNKTNGATAVSGPGQIFIGNDQLGDVGILIVGWATATRLPIP